MSEKTLRAHWISELPEDLRPLVITKGWRTPAEAIRSYAHLERLVGVDKAPKSLAEELAKALRDMKLLFQVSLLCTTPDIAKEGMSFVRTSDALLTRARSAGLLTGE